METITKDGRIPEQVHDDWIWQKPKSEKPNIVRRVVNLLQPAIEVLTRLVAR